MVITTLGTPLVDRRWPADEPLDPTEMLWGESGGYIKRHFPGLDVEIGKDINTPVHRGEGARRRGDRRAGRSRRRTSTSLKDGEVEVAQELRRRQRADRSAATAPGDTFGEVGILRRTPRTATIRAVTDAVVLQLPAEEFVAGVAFSAAEGNVLLARVNEYLAADAERAEHRCRRRRPPPPSAVARGGGPPGGGRHHDGSSRR